MTEIGAGTTDLRERIAAAAYGADCRYHGTDQGRTDADLWADSTYVKDGGNYAERGHYRLMADAALSVVQPTLADHEDVLHAIWLYVAWHWVSKQLATEQKELWADAIEAASHRLEPDDPLKIDRWWRDAP